MSEWNQSNVPPSEGYDFVPYGEPNIFPNNVYPYAMNENALYTPQFAQYYGQLPANVPNLESRQNTFGNNVDSSQGLDFNRSLAQSDNIESSSLTPTAKEFKPRNVYGAAEDLVNGGAIRKSQYYKNRTQNFDGTSHSYNRWNKNGQPRANFNRYDGYKGNNFKQGFNKQKKKNYNNFANNDYKLNEQEVDEHKSQGDERYSNDSVKHDNKLVERYNRLENHVGRYEKKYEFKKKGQSKNNYYNYNKRVDEVSGLQSTLPNNWRQNIKGQSEDEDDSTENKNTQPKEFKKKLDAGSQRERLQQLLERRLLECLVCCEKLKHTTSVWSCRNCYHILHLSCVIRWAKTSKLDVGWRCPACQNVCANVPEQYLCFCEKMTTPKPEIGILPHSCGEQCGRKPRNCEHICTILCHPGPCPDCTIMVQRSCGCGSTQQTVVCGSEAPVTCLNKCSKLLNCGVHRCSESCHAGPCSKCDEKVRQECHCGKIGRKVTCTLETAGDYNYSCGDVCGKQLSCGNHLCESLCHPGACKPCVMSPELVTTCPCGRTKLTDERSSCLDPVPCCKEICDKKLKCGQPSAPHHCQKRCHEGACPPCSLTTMVRCRCGHMDKELACSELKTKADDARCGKKCTKMRLCCKHKCNQMCCIEVEHICPLPCNRTLSCGLHRCEETCHRGRCSPCWRSSFQELYCECGASVLYPPVACGTRAPPCNQPCSRPTTCGHEVFHNCHTGPCPPCTVLTRKWCYGRHEQRSAILCHQKDFSCGLPCGKPMPCGRHKCIQTCHSGECPLPCTQPCTVIRQTCQHPCNQSCHEQPCMENVPCKQVVRVTCQCGLRSSSRSCMELASEYQNIAMSQLASKMADIQKGQTVDISDIISGQRKPTLLKTLECNDECRLIERNRRLAIGLQIRNPDLSSKLTPRYSDFMRNWGKKDIRFCQHIHDKLTELVQLAKQSKQKSRSYSFETMNRDKRHFVHEYCEHFGCDSEAYDAEPNRNIVATAYRDKSWLPSVSLLDLMKRESGQRKVPGPAVLGKSLSAKPEVVSLKLMNSTRPVNKVQAQPSPIEPIDYFNDPPEVVSLKLMNSTRPVNKVQAQPSPIESIDYFNNPPV